MFATTSIICFIAIWYRAVDIIIIFMCCLIRQITYQESDNNNTKIVYIQFMTAHKYVQLLYLFEVYNVEEKKTQCILSYLRKIIHSHQNSVKLVISAYPNFGLYRFEFEFRRKRVVKEKRKVKYQEWFQSEELHGSFATTKNSVELPIIWIMYTHNLFHTIQDVI
jgi:hypothetical protein